MDSYQFSENRLNEELEKSSQKYHALGAWVAIVFDPLFGLTDYFNIPNSWKELLFIRFSISIITLLTIIFRKKYQFPSYWIVFVPFFLISLQNAYTFTKIDIAQFTGHTLNYIALWIGAGMFILWRWQFSAVIIASSALANFVFFNMNHAISLQEGLVNGGLLLIVVGFFMIMLIQTRYALTRKNILSQMALEESKNALARQKAVTDQQNKNMLDSIRYAKRIQGALLPTTEKISNILSDFFILYMPKDIVSGDFYWFSHQEEKNKSIIIAADCTGHGVPGAFMSVIGDALLNQIVHKKETTRPDLILNEMHLGVREMLSQGENESRDGMDMAICMIDWEKQKLYYAGAMNSFLYVNLDENPHERELFEIKADKSAIGGSLKKKETERIFTLHELPFTENTLFYLFSDGYADEIGGAEDKKFSTKKFKQLLLDNSYLPLEKQKEILEETIKDWLKHSKQIDDILVLGVKSKKKCINHFVE